MEQLDIAMIEVAPRRRQVREERLVHLVGSMHEIASWPRRIALKRPAA